MAGQISALNRSRDQEFEVMLGRARRPVELVVVAMWIGVLIVSVATSGRDGRSPLASNPLGHLILALLITEVGGLLLVERAHYVGVYERGINRGPFRMGNAAISRLVVGSGMCLVLAGMLIGALSLRRLIAP